MFAVVELSDVSDVEPAAEVASTLPALASERERGKERIGMSKRKRRWRKGCGLTYF